MALRPRTLRVSWQPEPQNPTTSVVGAVNGLPAGPALERQRAAQHDVGQGPAYQWYLHDLAYNC
jgi:hypothetical protein